MTAAAPALVARGEERMFYDHLRQHELVFQRCVECGETLFPLRTICPHCASEDLAIEVSARRGTLYSFTTQYRAAHPHFADSVPYSLALVDLDEGVRVFASVDGASPDDLEIGMPVEFVFEDVTDDVTLLRIRSMGDGR